MVMLQERERRSSGLSQRCHSLASAGTEEKPEPAQLAAHGQPGLWAGARQAEALVTDAPPAQRNCCQLSTCQATSCSRSTSREQRESTVQASFRLLVQSSRWGPVLCPRGFISAPHLLQGDMSIEELGNVV